MENRINILKLKIEELQKWKSDNSRTQIQYPIGVDTRQILRRNRISYRGQFTLAPIYDTSIEVSLRGVKFLISASKH